MRSLLDTYGGTRIVHGHSPIPYLLGEVGSEDGEDDTRTAVEGLTSTRTGWPSRWTAA